MTLGASVDLVFKARGVGCDFAGVNDDEMEGEWEDEFPVGEDEMCYESGVDLLRFSSTLAHGLLLIAVGLWMGALGLATHVLAPIGEPSLPSAL